MQMDFPLKDYPNIPTLLGGSSQDLDTWLVIMVPLSRVAPLPNGSKWPKWLTNGTAHWWEAPVLLLYISNCVRLLVFIRSRIECSTPPKTPNFASPMSDPDSSFSPLFLKEMKSSEKMIHLRINFSDFLLLFRRLSNYSWWGSHHPGTLKRVKSKQVLLISRDLQNWGFLEILRKPERICASRCWGFGGLRPLGFSCHVFRHVFSEPSSSYRQTFQPPLVEQSRCAANKNVTISTEIVLTYCHIADVQENMTRYPTK